LGEAGISFTVTM